MKIPGVRRGRAAQRSAQSREQYESSRPVIITSRRRCTIPTQPPLSHLTSIRSNNSKHTAPRSSPQTETELSRRASLALSIASVGAATVAVSNDSAKAATTKGELSADVSNRVTAPATMHAATVRTFGEAKDVLSVSEIQVPGPLMIEPGTGKMLLRVLACSTSPGDWRTFRGDVDFIRRPAFPYVPSGDICGIVMQVDGRCPRFRVGDCVVATWTETPLGGMAEYAVVDCQLAIPKPTGLSVIEAAALPNSSLHALDVLREANVTPGERVLVLGGSGGVGTALVQLVKRKTGASFVATTSTQTELMYSLGADRVVDHEHENWWDLPEFVDSQAFDVVIDCAEGLEGWERAKRSAAVKPGVLGGRFIAVSSDEPRMQIHNAQQMASFASTMLLREPFYKLRAASAPSWRMYLGGATPESLAELSSIVEEGWFRVVVDPRGPFPFTTDGVRAAYDLQASFHAHGKVVVQMDLDAQLQ